MPNYVKNHVRIYTGNSEVFEKLKKQIITKDENGNDTFSFQSVIPRPASLDIMSGSQTDNGMDYLLGDDKKKEEVKSWYKKDKDNKKFDEAIKFGKIALENKKKYGYPTWYEWNIANWGTKWDTCDCETPEMDNDTIILDFQTAWSTPFEVFQNLSKQYPNIIIDVEYADEDLGSNCGVYGFEDGTHYEESRDYDFACKLWGYTPEEVASWNEEENVE